ncbi:MAG: ribosomal subunit interface protein [SAR202 cluster bacterium Io17-Chloro-G4]|nr:MAG: ribosomal subunit interface protein [SAR202 cluster bacterium Io17-Chloro-G4]
MELNIRGRNLEITDRIRSHISEKLGQLESHLPSLSAVTVELSTEPTRAQRHRVVAQVTMNVSGSILRSEQRATNANAAINAAAEVLNRRIERYKGRTYRSERARQGTSLANQQAEEIARRDFPAEGEVLSDGNLVRIKKFEMEPMTVDAAAFQMGLLGHQFYMFLNSKTTRHIALYQRDDGNYGLIQPD